MYRLAITRDFIARHFLIGGDWGPENTEHSHHYRAEVIIEGTELDQHGYLIDIVAFEKALLSIIGNYSDRVLNDQPLFKGLNPSIEHFSRIIWVQLKEQIELPGKHMTVRLWENEQDWSSFGGPL